MDSTGPVMGAGGVVIVLVGLVVWVVKFVLPAFVRQSSEVVSGALANMQANTKALSENTKVTAALAKQIETNTATQQAVNGEFLRTLERIERRMDR